MEGVRPPNIPNFRLTTDDYHHYHHHNISMKDLCVHSGQEGAFVNDDSTLVELLVLGRWLGETKGKTDCWRSSTA